MEECDQPLSLDCEQSAWLSPEEEARIAVRNSIGEFRSLVSDRGIEVTTDLLVSLCDDFVEVILADELRQQEGMDDKQAQSHRQYEFYQAIINHGIPLTPSEEQVHQQARKVIRRSTWGRMLSWHS